MAKSREPSSERQELANRLPLVPAILLAIGATAIFLMLSAGWITNLSEFTTLVVSGLVVAMYVAAGAMAYRAISSRSGQKSAVETMPPEVQPAPAQPEPERPLVSGEVMRFMTGTFSNPENPSETLTAFTLFMSLVNETKVPAYLTEFEMYVDIGAGFERMKAFRGVSSDMTFHFGEVVILDFTKRLIQIQMRDKPLKFGVPLYGFLMFGGPKMFYEQHRKGNIRAIKVIGTDQFGQRNEIVSESKNMKDVGLIGDLFGVQELGKFARGNT